MDRVKDTEGRGKSKLASFNLRSQHLYFRVKSCSLCRIVLFLHLHPLGQHVAQLPLVEVLDVLLHVGLAEVGARAALDDALEWPHARMGPLVAAEAIPDLQGIRDHDLRSIY